MPSNTDNIIDSREIIARLDELLYLHDSFNEGDATCELGESELAELTTLESLASEGEDYAEDWKHGATLIHDSYFETFAREYADDIYDMRDKSWPFSCIDWNQAARELQMDYTSLDFDGQTYWIR